MDVRCPKCGSNVIYVIATASIEYANVYEDGQIGQDYKMVKCDITNDWLECLNTNCNHKVYDVETDSDENGLEIIIRMGDK